MKNLTLIIATVLPFLFFSCSDNKLELTGDSATLYFGDEYQIKAESKSDIAYESLNEYHAVVSETGLVTARFVGNTDIAVTSGNAKKMFHLTVAPKYNTYPEPKITFGQTKREVENAIRKADYEDATSLTYANYSTKAPGLICLFDDYGKLKSYSVLVKTAYSSELANFLVERYFPADVQNLIFVNGLTIETVTMGVVAKLYNTSYWMVVYVPNDSSKSAKSSTDADFTRIYDTYFN